MWVVVSGLVLIVDCVLLLVVTCIYCVFIFGVLWRKFIGGFATCLGRCEGCVWLLWLVLILGLF